MIKAEHDPALDLVIAGSKALTYEEGADAAIDRPPHVRAGSGLVVGFGAAWVVQDDAHFLGRIDLATARVGAITLPAGPGGLRQFDPVRGNKKDKLDLECLVNLGSPRLGLLAMGSGSTPVRRRLVRISLEGGVPVPEAIDADAFYRTLEDEKRFSGSQLNIEGAVLAGSRLVLFQRGNGAAKDGLEPVNATCEVALDDALRGDATSIERIRQYDLGAAGSVRLSFTDAAVDGDGIPHYLAVAEDSPNTYDDGPTTGVVLGRIDAGSGAATYGWILESDRTPSVRKLEGLAWETARSRWLAVEDKDDPTRPSELVWMLPALTIS